MQRRQSLDSGAWCAMLLALSYVAAGVTYLFLPPEQKGGTILHAPSLYLASVARDSTLLVANHLALGIGALFGIGVVVAVWTWTRAVAGGWMLWVSTLGVLGFAVTAVDNFQIAAHDPIRAGHFIGADVIGRTALVLAASTGSIDPQMWLSFGLTGVWLLVVSAVVVRHRLLPVSYVLLGIVVAASSLCIEIASVTNTPGLLVMSAGVGGLVAAPAWYVWLGVVLHRRGEPLTALAA